MTIVLIFIVFYSAPPHYVELKFQFIQDVLSTRLLSRGKLNGCNATLQRCTNNLAGDKKLLPLFQATTGFDSDNAWGYTVILPDNQLLSIASNGLRLDGKPCMSACSASDDGNYYCSDGEHNMLIGCALIGHDWTGVKCNGHISKDKSTGVISCLNTNDQRRATHPPFCFDGDNFKICTLYL